MTHNVVNLILSFSLKCKSILVLCNQNCFDNVNILKREVPFVYSRKMKPVQHGGSHYLNSATKRRISADRAMADNKHYEVKKYRVVYDHYSVPWIILFRSTKIIHSQKLYRYVLIQAIWNENIDFLINITVDCVLSLYKADRGDFSSLKINISGELPSYIYVGYTLIFCELLQETEIISNRINRDINLELNFTCLKCSLSWSPNHAAFMSRLGLLNIHSVIMCRFSGRA